jgi:hypothetical protein
MSGEPMRTVQQQILESGMDDWISDYEVQGEFQAGLSLTREQALEQMAATVEDWVRRGVLVAGDMRDGFAAWADEPTEAAARFAREAAAVDALSQPGQICWFDTGPAAADELAKLRDQVG